MCVKIVTITLTAARAPALSARRDRGLDFGTQRVAARLGLDGAVRQHLSTQLVWPGAVIPSA